MQPLYYLATLLSDAECSSTEANWLAMKDKVGHFLMLPIPWYAKLIIILLGLTITVLVGWGMLRLIMKWRFKRTLSVRSLLKLELGLLVLSLALLSPWGVALASRGLVMMIPPDTGAPMDAIVVLGRGAVLQKDRVDVAASLWQAQRAPLIFASGIGDAPIILEELHNQGIPEAALDGEGCSLTTEENAQFTAAALRPKGIQRILLVTDAPHMLRSLLTFQSFGFQVTPHIANLPTLTRKQRTVMVFGEYGGLVNYGLRGRFFGRSSEIVATTSSGTIETDVN
jgi:uncharacterized SAM-binding protein YcdF (DUF218 family)